MFFTMHPPTDDSYPRICREVGLSCESCTAESARQLAAVCKGLRGKMIGQLFVQIFPHPACARMHSRFAEHYVESAGPRTAEIPERAMTAVA